MLWHALKQKPRAHNLLRVAAAYFLPSAFCKRIGIPLALGAPLFLSSCAGPIEKWIKEVGEDYNLELVELSAKPSYSPIGGFMRVNDQTVTVKMHNHFCALPDEAGTTTGTFNETSDISGELGGSDALNAIAKLAVSKGYRVELDVKKPLLLRDIEGVVPLQGCAALNGSVDGSARLNLVDTALRAEGVELKVKTATGVAVDTGIIKSAVKGRGEIKFKNEKLLYGENLYWATKARAYRCLESQIYEWRLKPGDALVSPWNDLRITLLDHSRDALDFVELSDDSANPVPRVLAQVNSRPPNTPVALTTLPAHKRMGLKSDWRIEKADPHYSALRKRFNELDKHCADLRQQQDLRNLVHTCHRTVLGQYICQFAPRTNHYASLSQAFGVALNANQNRYRQCEDERERIKSQLVRWWQRADQPEALMNSRNAEARTKACRKWADTALTKTINVPSYTEVPLPAVPGQLYGFVVEFARVATAEYDVFIRRIELEVVEP